MYPGLRDLVGLEIDTLQTISKIQSFQALPGLVAMASPHRSLRRDGKSVNFHTDFVLDVRLRGNTREDSCNRCIHLGGLIEGNNLTDEVLRATYSLVLFRKNNVHSPVIRKLHFDYESPTTRDSQAKPSSHIQICGKASPHLISAGFNSQRLDAHYPHFEQPRIPAMPTSLALLIDWLFTEFQTSRVSQEIHKNEQWKKQVVSADDLPPNLVRNTIRVLV